MTPLPIPASVIPTGGPWGSGASATIDGTILLAWLGVVLIVTVAIGVAGALAHWRRRQAHRPTAHHPVGHHLTMRSA